ncbi:conserved hypothetical protein [Methylocella silvestris BL2]|uniref:Uncharacterized protein n=1 Tax=Methylocella silvestris (strain DSM 15510 / CIP 108128 / LMG 27833 / NCIMB 13906 / BL2) TaxID=395965 RepID=B8ETG4_METSB|nr:hypothetical protein [Methylocella silvestris]ACK51806.1 conserved hypothetical protein [Methylocella silvestris BL2]
MYLIAGACFLTGIIFGRCFKVYVLAPTCAVVFFVSLFIAYSEAHSLPWAAFDAAVRLALLQLGYVGGLIAPAIPSLLQSRGTRPAGLNLARSSGRRADRHPL